MSNLCTWLCQPVCSSFGFVLVGKSSRGPHPPTVSSVTPVAVMAPSSHATAPRETRPTRKYAEPTPDFSDEDSSYKSEDESISVSSSDDHYVSTQPGTSAAAHRRVSFTALRLLLRSARLSADLCARC